MFLQKRLFGHPESRRRPTKSADGVNAMLFTVMLFTAGQAALAAQGGRGHIEHFGLALSVDGPVGRSFGAGCLSVDRSGAANAIIMLVEVRDLDVQEVDRIGEFLNELAGTPFGCGTVDAVVGEPDGVPDSGSLPEGFQVFRLSGSLFKAPDGGALRLGEHEFQIFSVDDSFVLGGFALGGSVSGAAGLFAGASIEGSRIRCGSSAGNCLRDWLWGPPGAKGFRATVQFASLRQGSAAIKTIGTLEFHPDGTVAGGSFQTRIGTSLLGPQATVVGGSVLPLGAGLALAVVELADASESSAGRLLAIGWGGRHGFAGDHFEGGDTTPFLPLVGYFRGVPVWGQWSWGMTDTK